MSINKIVTSKNIGRLRNKLKNCSVPLLVTKDNTAAAYDEYAQELNKSLATNSYFPSNTLGYLGYPKKDGCTRFVPILSALDTVVYYSIVWALEDDLIDKIDGVFGAWHTKPSKVGLMEAAAENAPEFYGGSSFNKYAWFKEWRSYSDLLNAVLSNKSVGNYVLTSDIANFYDTIDVGHLCDRIRSKITEQTEVVSLLRFFLQHWERRLKGYAPSSKGIPQEIISDASRTLANFYLNEFDRPFKELCDKNGVTYIRWADDILLVGASKRILEKTLHQGSRLLLKIGLNFNASKTQHYTRKGYYEYRALEVLRSTKTASAKVFEKLIRKFIKNFEKTGGRKDSVFRACITKLYSNSNCKTPFMISFVMECAKDYQLLSALDEKHLARLCAIAPKPKECLISLVNLAVRYPYASTKAQLLESMRRRMKMYARMGINESAILTQTKKIRRASEDSEILLTYCLKP